jgi:hypothetical protein
VSTQGRWQPPPPPMEPPGFVFAPRSDSVCADETAWRLIAVHRRLLRPPCLLSGLSPILPAPVAPVLSAALSGARAASALRLSAPGGC